MSKLHRKCIVASTGMHVLLLLVLLVGPAFLMRSEKGHDMPVLEFIPDILVDAPVQGGGNPDVKTPPPVAPAKPERQPVTVKADPQPVTAKADPQPKAKDPEPQPDTTPKWKPSEPIKINTTKTTRNANPPTKPRITSPDTSKVFAEAAKSIRAAASSTTIEMPSLGAGSGPAYANYAQAVKSIYERNWYPPDDTSRDDALVKVQVVIAKDGKVVSAKITSRCGDAAIDGTVDATLRRVTSVPAFPAGAKESTRTYIIGFNLKAKRAL